MASSRIRRAGVIDIGSNSIRLIIGEKRRKEIVILELIKNHLPLGEDTFRRGNISQATINTVITILDKYRAVLKTYNVTVVKAIATTAVREASNSGIFIDTVNRKTDFRIEILSVGDVVFNIDTYLFYNLQGRYPIHDRNLLIVELGAGTVDFSIMQKGYVLASIGLPIGTLRLERLLASLEGDMDEKRQGLREFIEHEFRSLKRYMPEIPLDDVIFMSEDFADCIQGLLPDRQHDRTFFRFTREDGAAFNARCSELSPDALVHKYKLAPELAGVAGMLNLMVNAVFPHFGLEHIYIVETTLSHALLANILFAYGLPQKHKTMDQLISLARTVCVKHGVSLEHAGHVAHLSGMLFTGLRSHLGLVKNDLKFLLLAAYFHDIGKAISNRAHHKHSQYIINALSLFRLTDVEINLVANIARYHRKAVPSPRHPQYQSLPPRMQLLAQKLASILRVADALDRSHLQKIGRVAVEISATHEIMIIARCDDVIPLERLSFGQKKDLLEGISGSRLSLTRRDTLQETTR